MALQRALAHVGSSFDSQNIGECPLSQEIVAKVPRNWIVTLTVPVLAVLPEFVFRSVWRQLYPDDHHIIQEHLKVSPRSAALIPGANTVGARCKSLEAAHSTRPRVTAPQPRLSLP